MKVQLIFVHVTLNNNHHERRPPLTKTLNTRVSTRLRDAGSEIGRGVDRVIRAGVGCMLHEDICERGRKCVDSRIYHVRKWSRFGARYHALHIVKPDIECLPLDMSRVRIEMKLFVERVNDGEGLKKAEGQRIGRCSEDRKCINRSWVSC
jgi:hypothetical protein